MKQTFALPTHKNAGRKVAYVNARLFDAASGLDKKGALLTIGGLIERMRMDEARARDEFDHRFRSLAQKQRRKAVRAL